QKRDYATSAYTKDIQPADVKMSLSFNLRAESVVFTYKNYGLDWEEKIVIPNLHQALKDEIGKQNAVELVANREEVANKILLAVNKALEDLPIRATSFQLLDISFSDVFEKAIESKVVAVQKAQEAENVTKQIQEEAKQKVISAEAEARSMTIRAQALSQNRALVSYEAVQKWDGKLPVYSLGGSVPFINIKD
ncbi:MAG: prohibitin family protein, partial [Spirochaetia bacterium]|nr:prohibitin family protein [Spirochaetia bacterium]